MIGGDTTGTLNAVYEFLHYQFGYEAYTSEAIDINQNVSESKLLDFDISKIPDIAVQESMSQYFRENKYIEGHKMGFDSWRESFVNLPGSNEPWHNTLDVISPEKYYDEHPKWFYLPDDNLENGNLHYTAHGDDAELEALQDEVFRIFTESIEREFSNGNYPDQIGFMSMDNKDWVSSDEPFLNSPGHTGSEDSVQEFKDKYGGAYAAAMQIKFINPIAKRLKAYMEENWPGREMNIMIFAYLACESAPVKLENGNYVPIDKDVVVEDNVTVLIAPIYADYGIDLQASTLPDLADRWAALSNNRAFWFYDYYFAHTLFYFDTTYNLQALYKFAKDNGCRWIFNESPTEEHLFPFGNLKLYIQSKLSWNVDCDVNKIIDNFFKGYFKNAAGNMRKFFDELTSYCAWLRTEKNISGYCGSDPDNKMFWEENVVNGFMDYINAALEDIKAVSDDEKLYQQLYDRIIRESLMPRYIQLRHFSLNSFEDDDSFQSAVKNFKADCARFGITSSGLNMASINSMVFSR